jgi:hypothetical protein
MHRCLMHSHLDQGAFRGAVYNHLALDRCELDFADTLSGTGSQASIYSSYQGHASIVQEGQQMLHCLISKLRFQACQ